MRSLLFALLLALGATSQVSAASQWQVDHEASRLGFVATQSGRFEGQFNRFTADMRFASNDLANSAFVVEIDVTSVDTGSQKRDRELPKSSWFNFDAFPKAYYRAETIRQTNAGYEAVGELTIRDNTHPVTLPFTWETTGDTARMNGEVVIDRIRYDIGQGDWADPSVVAHDVRVVVDLTLTR
jgi:polyisoprenoid-binding protein YceI